MEIGDYSLQTCGKSFMVEKLLQYRISNSQNDENNEERLQILGSPAAVYFKNLNSLTDEFPKTINFTLYRNNRSLSEGVYLVLEAMTFNILQIAKLNVFVLCASNISTHRFILYFPHARARKNFWENSFVETLINSEIPCPTHWFTHSVLQQVYSI